MKLNVKRTILVGFAFFLISAFWQAYDTIVPLIMTNKFQVSQTFSGTIMSLDNILALFMLPLFGGISDRICSKFGKRTPFIFIGTIFACCFFIVMGYVNSLPVFIVFLLLTLISMAIFRSPAVALMPDITPKPLRSKGNAIINLMGTAGGIIILLFATVFNTNEPGKTDFSAYIISVCGVMLAALAVFILTVKENKWSKDMLEKSLPEADKKEENPGEKRKLSKGELRSLIFILASVALWYIGYNAITSKYSVYATEVLEMSYSLTLMVAQAAAIISYIPVGILASKIGRKKSILIGVALITSAFAAGIFITKDSPLAILYAVFALAGIGWATINVNSFPMVVELAKVGDVGKYTGFYYTASMAAQVFTPILSGALIDAVGWNTFFPYATVFVALSFVTMLFVKHGDSKPIKKADVLENLDADM